MKNKLFMMILVLAIGVLAACGAKEDDANNSNADSSTDKQVLKVGTSADYAPFEYVDAAKGEEIIGFDIDLIKLVGEKNRCRHASARYGLQQSCASVTSRENRCSNFGYDTQS
ncbi:transporter substrate-binding domain-containing protein [Lysinibacillus sp. MHQ-1]|nr:transporter substrate-binding domain-containing protein [Lysinibacillus sp. MHQ-1]